MRPTPGASRRAASSASTGPRVSSVLSSGLSSVAAGAFPRRCRRPRRPPPGSPRGVARSAASPIRRNSGSIAAVDLAAGCDRVRTAKRRPRAVSSAATCEPMNPHPTTSTEPWGRPCAWRPLKASLSGTRRGYRFARANRAIACLDRDQDPDHRRGRFRRLESRRFPRLEAPRVGDSRARQPLPRAARS